MFEQSLANLPFPGELRNRIYQHLLSSSCTTSSSDHHINICGILGTSKATRLETRPIYYSRTTWKFASAEAAVMFFARLTPDSFPDICTLIIQDYPSDRILERRLSDWLRVCWNLRSLEVCISETFIRSKLPLRGGIHQWDAKDLGLARLRGLQAFDICIHDDPSGPYKWKWRSTNLGLSLKFSKPPISRSDFTQLRIAIPPLITSPSRRMIRRQRQNVARQQKLAQRIKFYRETFGTSSIITRSECKPPIYYGLVSIYG